MKGDFFSSTSRPSTPPSFSLGPTNESNDEDESVLGPI